MLAILLSICFLVLNCLRAEEDAWVFEEPVTESIAPGYFDVVSKPMDYSTIEKKIETNNYKSKEEASGSCTCSLGGRLAVIDCHKV